ncbi:hypothetical protein Zm00014a_035153 [Zea mays]|uniref:Uncharacterized protein n=2 Tax=Zea mays TaxID=4577 RepID=A0A3L6ECA2_MAIZE|nr:hypothetical protein Zm00014a_035153 [Zea mays]
MALYVPLLSSWTSTKNDALAVLLCLSAEWENSGTFEAGATEAALSAVSEAEAVAAVLASLDEAWRCGGGCQAGRWCGAAGDQDGVQHGAVVGVCGGLAAILSCCAGGAMTASQVMVAPAQLGTGTDHSSSQTTTMSLACLVCHGMSSPSHSLRSYSVSSSEEESRCGAVVACLARRVTPAGTSTSVGTSKVTPFPPVVSDQVGTEGAPRLQRSRAVSRDLVRDWNFDEVIVAN